MTTKPSQRELELMGAILNPGEDPNNIAPEQFDQLLAKVRQAPSQEPDFDAKEIYNKFQENPPTPLRAPQSETEPSEHDPLGGAFTAASLLSQEFPPVEYVVPGVITEGLGIIVAPPKIGKSWMVLGVALACSAGGTAFNAIQVKQRPVLYLALEDGPRRLQDRLHTLGVTTGNDDLTFMTETPAGAYLTIGAFIERFSERNPLVILDTLGKARDVYTGNDAYQKDYKELSAFKDLVDRHPGATLLIVHHTNKGSHGDFVSSVSGTQGITGAADSVLTIERGRGEDEAVLNVTSRDAAEGSYAMTFDNGAWCLEGADLAEAASAVHTRKAITGVGDGMAELIELVSKHPEGIKSKDVATLLHWEDDKARNYLRRAYESGRIQRLVRGVYAPVLSVPSVPFPNGTKPIGTQSTQGAQGEQFVPAGDGSASEHSSIPGSEQTAPCQLHGTDYMPECYTCDRLLRGSAP